MFKVILFLLVALGAALYFPESRVVVLDTAAPVLNPVFEWSTKGEMRKITRDLATFERSWESLPSPNAFPDWLSKKYHSDAAFKDSWGHPYTLQAGPDSFSVVSPGIDGMPNTPDDLRVSEQRAPSTRKRRRRR